MIIKKIEIEMAFEDDFTPPDKFDKSDIYHQGKCDKCPFNAEDDVWQWCVLLTDEPKTDICPIKKYFKE